MRFANPFTIDNSPNMRVLFGIRVLREFANKFSLFFLPVFLFQIGSEIRFLNEWGLTEFQSGMVMMALYFAGLRLSVLAFAFPVGNFIRRRGFSAALSLAHVLYAVTLISLRVSMDNPSLLPLAMVADGAGTILMWGSFLPAFSKGANKTKMGRDLGFVQVLLNLIWLIAPALSGVVILLFGYELLFSVGLVIVGLVAVLALFLDLPHERDTISFRELRFWISDRRFVKLGVSIAGKTIHDLAIYVWPLYVFLLLGNTEQVGFVYGASFLLSIFLSMIIGRKLDSKDRKKPFLFSGGVLSALWIIRSQVLGFWSVAVVDALDKLTGNFHWLFFDRVLLNRGKGREAFSYFMYREIIVSSTAVLFWLLLASMFLIWRLDWFGLFVMAAAGALMSLLVGKKHD